MNKSKWFWRGILALFVLYIVFSVVSRSIAINRLSDGLRNGSPDEQVAAANQLIRRDRLFDVVQKFSKKEKLAAAGAIEQIDTDQAIKRTLVLLKDADEDVRKRITEALTVMAEDKVDLLIPAMKDSDENVRNGAKDALVALGEKSIPKVREAVKETDLRDGATDVLVRIGEPAVPAFVQLLNDEDQDVRMTAADCLAKIGSEKATPALLEATRDDAAVRRVAISALCTICDPRAMDLFVEVLGNTRDDGEVRARAARALSVIGGARAINTLTAALGDWDLKVRTSVITGLQRIGEPAVGPVMSAMSGGSRDVRRAGAQALEKIDAPAAASALMQLAQDSDPAVRASAAKGLAVQTANARVGVLVSMLADKDGSVADAASDSIARLAETESRTASIVQSLVSSLKSGASDVVKYRVADVLGRIGAPAVPSLASALESGGETSRWAAYALGQTGESSAKAVLSKFKGASDPELATVVNRALARM